MYYYEFKAYTPYCGTENYYYEEFDYQPTEKELIEMAKDFASENGESYEYLVFGWDADPVGEGEMTEEEYQTEIENYYADCDCEIREISEEEYYDNV
jgi:hypothetical protein